MPFAAGSTVGPYRILEQLGQGGMATVYKAYHASLDRYVAVKVLHQAFLEDPNFLARFQREARVVARLEHPNIVPIYDYAEQDGQPYLVMKYIEGETLKARLQRERLSPSELERIVENVGAGLAYAHKQGVLHRDIKPSNVILSTEGGIYLADFGLARIAQAGESTLTSDMVLGTPQYISPEQALGKKDLDEGTDIYSFGVMLYEMTAGRVPFSSDTPFSVIHDHIYTPLPLPSQVNPSIAPSLERILLKALAKDRADRFADIPALVQAFKETWEPNAPTEATRPAPEAPTPTWESTPQARTATLPIAPPPATPSRWKKFAPWAVAGLMLGLLLCAGLGFFALRQAQKTQQENAIQTQVAATVAAGQPSFPHPSDPNPPEDPGSLQQPQPGAGMEIPDITLEEARRNVDARPDDPKAHLVYGYVLLEEGQEDTAYEQLTIAAEQARQQPVMLVSMGLAMDRREEFLAALILYSRLERMEAGLPLAMDRLRETTYYAYEEENAPQYVPFSLLSGVDRISGMMADAVHSMNYDTKSAEQIQSIIDDIRREKPEVAEAELLQAELFLFMEDKDSARATLQKLVARTQMPEWIMLNAREMLESIP